MVESTRKLLPRVRTHIVSEERMVCDKINDKRLQPGQKVEVVFRKPIKKTVKAKPDGCPDQVTLWLLADREAAEGFYEAALIHRWAPLEYGLKYLKWKENPTKGWPQLLNTQNYLSQIEMFSPEIRDQIKATIYATSTITDLKKDSDHKTAKALLSELKLKKTVKDWRNATVHEGARIDQGTYQSCKELIITAWDSFELDSRVW